MSWIKRLNCKETGYNRTDGGEGIKGLKFTAEHCANISAALKGRKLTPEQLERVTEFLRNLPRYVPTAEDFAKQSKTKRKVVYPNLDVELVIQNLTYREVARRIGKTKSNVLDKLSGARPIDKEMALAIRELLQVEMPIEELFAKINDDGELENTTTFAKNRRIIFPNLEAELQAQNISHWELARLLEMNRVTLGDKLNGKSNIDEKTARAIYELLKTEISFEKLFERAEEFPAKKKAKPVVHHEVIHYPNLLAELTKRNMSYLELARLLGVNKDVIAQKMRGVYKLDKKTHWRYANSYRWKCQSRNFSQPLTPTAR
ncbi:MAG: hypothetical protein J5809_04445 [Selenomonadaceae bacterium]|nr:hypothetical protein [Selenomonadaceae bacterium]